MLCLCGISIIRDKLCNLVDKQTQLQLAAFHFHLRELTGAKCLSHWKYSVLRAELYLSVKEIDQIEKDPLPIQLYAHMRFHTSIFCICYAFLQSKRMFVQIQSHSHSHSHLYLCSLNRAIPLWFFFIQSNIFLIRIFSSMCNVHSGAAHSALTENLKLNSFLFVDFRFGLHCKERERGKKGRSTRQNEISEIEKSKKKKTGKL